MTDFRAECWLRQIGLEQQIKNYKDKYYSICEEHFEEKLINRLNPSKILLYLNAFPTLKLPPQPGNSSSNSESADKFKAPEVENTNSTENVSPQPKKKKKIETNTPSLRRLDGGAVLLQLPSEPPLPKVCSIQKKIQALIQNLKKDEMHGMINGASTFTLKLHEIQLMLKNQSLLSSKAFKQLSLKLYLKFPNEYRSLHKLLDAPPKSELRDVFNDSIISTERLDFFALYLTLKANTMTVKQKQCFLYIGESKIKPSMYYDIKNDHLLGIHELDKVLKPESATKAVVLILQGIFDEWKQPIAIGYLGNTSRSIRPWVDERIKSLSQIGFNVRAIVHRDLSCFSKDDSINKKKTYCINDISFLFNSFYFNFIKAGYSFDGGFIARGQHIVEYYKLDSKKLIPLTPKLTDEIINPANVKELNIKSVMEVFSMTTAAAISAYIDFKLLGVSAKSTVELINKINKLYEILNTGHLDDKSKKGFVGDQSEIDFLTEMLKTFENLSLCNLSGDVLINDSHNYVVEKFKLLIKSTLSMWDSFKHEKYEYLPIWRFTTDVVGLFFDQVQKHSKSITKPTAKEVDSIFRQTAIIHLLKNPRKEFKPICMENVLTGFQTICQGFKVLNDDYINRELASSYKICSSEYMKLEMRRKDGIIFLAGFLLKKCNEIHKCDDLEMYISRTSNDVEALSMCESIMDDVRRNICVLPSGEFIEIVEAMEISFRLFFNKEVLYVINKKMLNSLLKFMDFDVQMPCHCFPVIYVRKLYCRLRIYQTLKYNNELNKTKICSRLMINRL